MNPANPSIAPFQPSKSAAVSPERFHALDATRAFALMLGVVFHAAWSFVSPSVGFAFAAPVVDASANHGVGWFFYTSHSFRMQVFFLIAGFFARMLYQKRGTGGFTRHRLLRIGVPLVLGWFVLFPMVRAAWVWGGNVSGRNLMELPLPVLFQLMFGKALMFVRAEQGGMFSLTHLWFLYYLLWLYAIALSIRAVIVRAPESLRLRERADRVMAFIAKSPWAIAVLALATGGFLWRMEGWSGVDTPVGTLAPSIPVLVLYGTFFILGWLIHRQSGLLHAFARSWKWQIAAGLAVSLGCYMVTLNLSARGYVVGSFRASYPYLSPDQIRDWGNFAATLKSPANSTNARPELAALWQRLPELVRRTILQLPPAPSPNAKAGVCDQLNRLLTQDGLFSAAPAAPAAIPSAAQAHRLSTQHRATLENLFAGEIIPAPVTQPSYSAIKLAYSFGYALTMWLLVFGTIGFFHAVFPAHSPAWRYVADSAYWIYLMHLPLVAVLQGWLSTWTAPAFVKLPLLLGIAFAVLFATYHYLVRSTFAGVLLNGQKFPFTPLPFAAPSREPRLADPILARSGTK